MLSPGHDYQFAEAVEIVFPDDAGGNEVAYRHWTGEGPLVHESNVYAAGGILEISEIQIGQSDTPATITLDIGAESDRSLFLDHDPGPAPVRVFRMWRKRPTGSAWPAWNIDEWYRGSLSTPQYADGTITISVQRVFDDVWRGVPLRWTGTDQRRRYPDDSGLDRSDRIRRSGIAVATT